MLPRFPCWNQLIQKMALWSLTLNISKSDCVTASVKILKNEGATASANKQFVVSIACVKLTASNSKHIPGSGENNSKHDRKALIQNN